MMLYVNMQVCNNTASYRGGGLHTESPFTIAGSKVTITIQEGLLSGLGSLISKREGLLTVCGARCLLVGQFRLRVCVGSQYHGLHE